ncbi:MAG: sulfurtransferase, partial [Rhodospirillales bacterium]|nr:sulfurtransferase [Rhodospirillales bacterium]
LMDADNSGAIRSADEISEAVKAAGLDPERPVVTTCGSGVTAAILSLGLYLIGHTGAAIYDGSWSEWGKREDTPFET